MNDQSSTDTIVALTVALHWCAFNAKEQTYGQQAKLEKNDANRSIAEAGLFTSNFFVREQKR